MDFNTLRIAGMGFAQRQGNVLHDADSSATGAQQTTAHCIDRKGDANKSGNPL
jgi:hypothetical protein